MLRRFLTDQRGNMAILFAVGFAVSAMVSAVAVDAAALYHERRGMQAAVDVAALQAARDPARAEAIVRAALTEAGQLDPDADLEVSVGQYRADEALLPQDRFVAGAANANAVSVRLRRLGALHFAASFTGSPMLGVQSLAMVTPEVSFSVGSRLASLNGGLANAILSRLLGTTVSLSVMDYHGLADARVDALAFLDALAQQVHLEAGTYDQLLAMEATTGDIAEALATLTSGATRTALNTLALGGAGNRVQLGKLVAPGRLGELALGSSDAVADLDLSVLEILTATAALADGDRQVSLNLGAAVPGLASLKLDLALGEPPQGGGWFAIGPAGAVVRTSQLRLRLLAQLLGGAVLGGAGVRLPVWLDLAHSEAQVASATCPGPQASNGTARIAVRPGVFRLAIGDLSDAGLTSFGTPPNVQPVRLVDALLLRITGSALAEMAQTGPVTLDFSSGDIGSGLVRTARTHTPVSSLFGSLFGKLGLTVSVLGLGLSSPTVIAESLRLLLAPLAPTLDLTLDGVLSTLGLGLGEADVQVYGVRCSSAVLVG